VKRCPVDQGGCGQLVEMLFNSGLCQSCDAAVQRGTAAAGGAPGRRRGARKPKDEPASSDGEEKPKACDKYVKGPERGICATCGATRAEHLATKRPGERKLRTPRASSNGSSDKAVLEELRDKYATELAELERRTAYMRVKVEAANEILSELQRAH
jgi:hypothetical protein